MPVELEFVSNIGEIRDAIAAFRDSVQSFLPQLRHQIRRDAYWVLDPSTGRFGPMKLVAYRGMNLGLYGRCENKVEKQRSLTNDDEVIGRFHGQSALLALARVVGGSAHFAPDPELDNRHLAWAQQLLNMDGVQVHPNRQYLVLPD